MRNLKPETGVPFKSQIRRLAIAALFTPLGLAFASEGHYRRPAVASSTSGHVEVTHQIPGGVVTVGVEFGRPKPIIVEKHREVVVVERPRHPHREVTIIREKPRHHHKEVTVIKTTKYDRCRKKVTVIEERKVRGHKKHFQGSQQVSYQKNNHNGSEHYYEDANQVSYQTNAQDGSYHYYEDANQVSVQDNRNGQNRNVYVRK